MARWDAHLDALMRDRYAALLAYASMLTAGDRAHAEDVVHDAVVKVFARGRSFGTLEHAEYYTRRAIVSAFIDGTRRVKRDRGLQARVVDRATMPPPDDAVASADAVRALLAQLPPRERACVVLRFYDDLTIAQTADRLGLAVGTVKRYLSDATARLAGQFGDDASADHLPRVPVVSSTRRTREGD